MRKALRKALRWLRRRAVVPAPVAAAVPTPDADARNVVRSVGDRGRLRGMKT